MKKEFYSNIPYNRQKRRSAIILNSLLIVLMLGSASMFAGLKDWWFALIFLLFAFLPISILPSAFKNYPIDGKPVLTVEDRSITLMGQTVSIKDVSSFRVIIELPASKLDSENAKTLNSMRTVKPDDEFMGNLDLFYYDSKRKKKMIYSHMEGVVGALESLIEAGIKNYSLSYSIKKNNVKSEFDFKNYISNKKQEEHNKATKKQKSRQLL